VISSVTQSAVDDGTTSSSALVNPVTTYTWNAYGQLLTRVDPTGREVRNGYDEDHYLETVTVENGASDIVTSFGRNAAGDITSVTDPTETHATYDASRRLTRYAAPAELQLYHYKARVYDPLLGRFLRHAIGSEKIRRRRRSDALRLPRALSTTRRRLSAGCCP